MGAVAGANPGRHPGPESNGRRHVDIQAQTLALTLSSGGGQTLRKLVQRPGLRRGLQPAPLRGRRERHATPNPHGRQPGKIFHADHHHRRVPAGHVHTPTT